MVFHLVSQCLVFFGIEASTSLGGSVSSVLSVPKSAGIVDEMILVQQLMTAFQAGLRNSLDDPDHDAMSDLSKKKKCRGSPLG